MQRLVQIQTYLPDTLTPLLLVGLSSSTARLSTSLQHRLTGERAGLGLGLGLEAAQACRALPHPVPPSEGVPLPQHYRRLPEALPEAR